MCDRSATPSVPTPSAFFSPIPRAVWDLCRHGSLKPRDVEVLGLLLDHKNRNSTQVKPRQATLADRLGCSVDTVQRALRRLEGAGLVAVTRLRDKLGRLSRCVYDLADTLALMPLQAARLRSGGWGKGSREPGEPVTARGDGARAESKTKAVGRTMPQDCGVLGVEEEELVRADSALPVAPAEPAPCPEPPPPAVVARMISLGVAAAAARRWFDERGDTYCRRVLEAAEKVKRFRAGKAAWIVAALKAGDYAFGGEAFTGGSNTPSSHRSYVHAWAGETAPPPDPLEGMPADRIKALEERARGELFAEGNWLVCEQLRRGRGWTFVRARMRQLAAVPEQ